MCMSQSSWNRNHVEQLREMQRQFRISIGGTKHPVGAPALGANTFAPPSADDDKV
jgi:hypothetical protein